MSYEQRDNTGSLFQNDNKKTANHPDYKGSCLVDGVEYWMDAWIKPNKDGTGRWMSFAFKQKGRRQERRRSRDDDVPF